MSCSSLYARINNQGEENIDCGGPCPNTCPVKIVTPRERKIKTTLLLITGILATIIIIKLARILKIKKILETPSKKRKKNDK